MIYHIYWGTAGNAGLYLDEIYKSIQKLGYEQKVFVSYYFPFSYGEKVFFKRTEMEHCKLSGFKRRVLQALELLFTLLKILRISKKDKPELVNYSYVSKGNSLILIFLKLLKRISGCKLVITCHDVIPFASTTDAYNKEMRIKAKIYSLSDAFIIHNENSYQDLVRLFKINENQIFEHPFPIMDLSKIDTCRRIVREKYDFLFIGHLRKAKGIEFLLDAWKDFHAINSNATLCIAGNPSEYKHFLKEHEGECINNNIELKLGFIKDMDYINLVKSSHCVVFPYNAGTNSGVISTVISLNRSVITSDIGMFANNPLISSDSFYKCGDKRAFINRLTEFYHKNSVDYTERIKLYRTQFNTAVKIVYSQLLQ